MDAAAGRPLVLVAGGSLGAATLNAVVRAAAPRLVEALLPSACLRPGKAAALDLGGYHQFEFVREGWGDLLAAADVAVSRAGANALFELLTLGKPNILVAVASISKPRRSDENAGYASQCGYSLVIKEGELNAERLVGAVRGMLAEGVDWRRRLAGFAAPPA